MAVSVRASKQGLEIVDSARKKKGWLAASCTWCDAAETSLSTLKRFRQGRRIRQDTFVKICSAVGLDWEEIVDDTPPTETSKIAWRLELNATIEEVDKAKAEAIIAVVNQLLGNDAVTLKRIDSGSVNLVLESDLEEFERISYLFKTGKLTELLDVPVLDVQLEDVQLESVVELAGAVNLGEWFRDNFAEAVQTGWLRIQDILGPTVNPAFRSNAVKRAKQIRLGDRALALIIDMATAANQQISLFLGVYPLGEQAYLPENLNLIVCFESGEPIEIPVENNLDGFSQEIFFSSGEEFSVEIASGNESVIEYFVI